MKNLFYFLACFVCIINVYPQSSLKTFIGLPADSIGPAEIPTKSQVIAGELMPPPKFEFIPVQTLLPLIPTSFKLETTPSVGEIPYTTSVNPMGGMTVSIPIEAYEDPRGFTPELTLTYNSMGGDGPLGYGWNLTGTSAISLINKSIYYDRKTEGALYNSADAAYALDGQRLVETGRTDGTVTFQTEQGNIKATGQNIAGFLYSFQVFYPDGKRANYGSGMQAMDLPNFNLTTLTDHNNNTIYYNYEQASSQNPYRLKSITYGYNQIASIEFTYEERKEVPLMVYACGGKRIIDYLLKSIAVKYNGSTLRRYTLENKRKGNSYEIDQIKCTAASSYLHPLTFYYGEEPVTQSFEEEEIDLKDWHPFTQTYDLRVSKGKFDYGSQNDGLATVPNKIHYLEYWRGNSIWKKSKYEIRSQYNGEEEIVITGALGGGLSSKNIRLKTGKGFVDAFCMNVDQTKGDEIVKINQYITDTHYETVDFHIYNMSPQTGFKEKYTHSIPYNDLPSHKDVKSVNPKFFYPGDYNGDGKMELLIVSADNVMGCHMPTTCQLVDLESGRILFSGSPFTFYQQFPKESNNAVEITPETAYNNSDKLYPLDYDGDGKTDLCLINSTGMHIYTFDVNPDTRSYSCRNVASNTLLTTNKVGGKELLVGELNGDGKNDLLLSPKLYETVDQWKLYFSKGDGKFEESTIPLGRRHEKEEQYLLQDIDGDGQTDLLRFTATDWTRINIHFIVNGKWIKSQPYSIYEKTILLPTEIQNKNYFSTLIALKKDGKATSLSYLDNEYKKKMLTGIVGSYKEVTKIGYLPLNDKRYEIYHSSDYVNPVSYPDYQDYNGGLIVVSNVANYYEGTLLKDLHYDYTNGVIHKQGLGFRGFQKVVCHEREGDSEKQYVQIYNPLNYSVLTEEDTPEEKNTYTWKTSTSYNKILTTRLTQKKSTDKLRNVTVTTEYIYDSYNNPTKETVNYGSGLSTVTQNTYENIDNASTYLTGLLKTQKITQTRDGKSFSTATKFTYNEHYLPASKTEEANDFAVSRQEYEYDDTWNLKTSKIQAYSSPDWQTETYQYDIQGRITLKTDPVGTYTMYAYNNKGLVSKTTDKKGLATSYEYDVWRRTIKTTYPDQTTQTISYKWNTEGPGSIYLVTTLESGQPEHRAYLDWSGRTVREGSMRFDGEFIYTDKEYDTKGRLAAESEPFKYVASQWNHYFYDTYDRLTFKLSDSGKQESYSYDGLTETSVINGITSAKTYDATGVVTRITDAGGTITYQYRPDGQLLSVTAPGNVVTEFEYDNQGRRTAIKDPSAGTKRFEYSLTTGNLIKETDANGQIVKMSYDAYNRLKTKSTSDVNVRYTYNAYGLLVSAIGNTHQKRYVYDKYLRLQAEQETLAEGKTFQKLYSYNEEGNIASIMYESDQGEIGTELYDYKYGNLRQINWHDGTVVWKLISENQRGQATQVLTNGITRTYAYDEYGMPTKREITQGGRSLQKFKYLFDKKTGNLQVREDEYGRETFLYDNLNRLTTISGQGRISYDDKGNIREREKVGAYMYSYSKPYQLAQMDVYPFTSPPNTQEVTYNAMMRPLTIKERGYTVTFTYSSDYKRTSMNVQNGNSHVLTRYYIGGNYEIDIKGQNTTQRLYLGGDAYSAPAVYYQGKIYNICRDYLGSVTLIVNNLGGLVERNSYDAWGRPRNPQTHEPYAVNSQPDFFLGRGYTGHEHIKPLCLINMNARLYAPLLGRFLSPDPYVQAPDFTQNFNRYAYCLNNPLAFTDQNGEFWNFIIGGLVGGLVNWIAHGCKFNAKGLGYFGVGAAAGVLGAGIGTGITAALTPGLTFGAGFMGAQATMHTIASSFSTSFVSGMAIGAGAGFSSGFVSGLGNGMVDGNNFGTSLAKGFRDGLMGGISGGIVGGLAGGISAAVDGRNFWHGGRLEAKAFMKLPQMTQADGSMDCRYMVEQSFDEYFNGEARELNSLRAQYPDISKNEYQLGKMYGKGGMVLTRMDVDVTQKIATCKSIADIINSGGGVSYEIKVPNGAHATAIKSIRAYSNGKIRIRLMNPDRYGSTRIRNFRDYRQLFSVFKLSSLL